MANDNTAPKVSQESPAPDWRKRDSFLVFLRDVAIAAVILGAGLYLYWRHEQTGRAVRALGKEAKEFMVKDSPKAYAEAEKRLLKMTELDANYPFALASLGELYATRWMDLGFEADKEPAHKWAKASNDGDAKINERFGAVILVMLGDKKYEEAANYAADITKKAASSHIVNGYGRALRALGRLDEARVALKKSADTEWRNPRFACEYADVFFEDGDYVNAQNFYAKGIEANSDHVRSQIGRSRAELARGWKIKEASDTLASVLDPKNADMLSPKLKAMALTGMSELRGFEQKFDEAVTFADQALQAYPNYSWAHFAKGRALAMLKNRDAGAELDKAIELDRYVPEFYYQGSNAMLEAGDEAKAQGLLDDYLKSLKEDDRYHLAYGNLLMKADKPEEALVHYEKAINQNNFNAVAHYSKGAALFDARKKLSPDPKDKKKEGELMDGAEKELKLALEVQEYFPAAYNKLGDIQFEKKEWGEGCQQYAQALMQLHTLQAPHERMVEIREKINTRLLKEAHQSEMARAWMKETQALIR
jgi:tetratricopeptide (TPR) repeat protein